MTTIPSSVECPVCSGATSVTRDAVMTVGARHVTVATERLHCSACAESFFTPDQLNAAQRAASSAIREAEDLIQPHDILAIRDQYSLTQANLERIIRAGAKTVARWERGTVFQNKATDNLLRLIRDVPGVFEYLARRSGLMPAPTEAVANQLTVATRHYNQAEPAQTAREARVLQFPMPTPRNERQVQPDSEAMLPREVIQ